MKRPPLFRLFPPPAGFPTPKKKQNASSFCRRAARKSGSKRPAALPPVGADRDKATFSTTRARENALPAGKRALRSRHGHGLCRNARRGFPANGNEPGRKTRLVWWMAVRYCQVRFRAADQTRPLSTRPEKAEVSSPFFRANLPLTITWEKPVEYCLGSAKVALSQMVS